jgi:hypothetical protein
MSVTGMKIIINELFGTNEDTVQAITDATNKEISAIKIDETNLVISFIDGTMVRFFDDGQSCCEHRSMNTDDELQDFVGAKFVGAGIQEGPQTTDPDGYSNVTESQFLIIKTSRGEFTVANYNNHNGYYGGFSLAARKE